MLFNKHNLNVAKIADAICSREEMTSVLFTKNLTCATNGYRLLEVSVDESLKVEDYPETPQGSAMRGCSPFLVPAKTVEGLKVAGAKGIPVTQCVAVKHVDGQKVEFLTTDLETARVVQARRIDAKFPDYERLFPQDKPVAEIMVNGELLSELVKIMAGLKKEVRVKFYGGERPLVLECGTPSQKARGLLMPIRQ